MALDRRRKEYHHHLDDYEEDYVPDVGWVIVAEGVDQPWRDIRKQKGQMYGVELELEAKGSSYKSLIKALPEHEDKDGIAPALEQDSTLDEDKGLEIIFPPVHPSVLKDGKSYFARCVKAVDRKAQLGDHCGMHINVNTHGWTDSAKSLFAALLFCMPRAHMEKMGGRKLTPYCEQDIDLDYYQEVRDFCEYEGTHDSCCEHKGNRYEVRFPKATTKLPIITRIVTFVELVEEFAKVPKHNKIKKPKDVYPTFLGWLANKKDPTADAIFTFLTT